MNEATNPSGRSVRRIVTGHDDDHKAVFVQNERVDAISPVAFGGVNIHWLYGADRVPDLPVSDPIPAHEAFYPPPGGVRFGFLTVPPQWELPTEGYDMDAAMAELERDLPGMIAHLDPSLPGMHRTASVDAVVVLTGNPTLELDDGATVDLSPGDTVIQNGTRHRWLNSGTTAATIAYFLCGVEKDLVPPILPPG